MGFRIKNGVLEKYTEEPGVTEIVIPDSVTSIGEDTFDNCTDLQTIITKTKLALNAFGKTVLGKPVSINDPAMLPQKGRVPGHNKAERGGI